MCERELETKQNCNILTPTHTAISVSFPFSWAAHLGVHSAGCWLSLPNLLTNWLNFLCTELYNSSSSTFFLWVSQIALIQPVHGQGYILIFLDRIHLLFTQVHFLFWQPGRVGGQYTTPSANADGLSLEFNDSKSPQVSRTLLSILVDLNYAVMRMVSTCPLFLSPSVFSLILW